MKSVKLLNQYCGAVGTFAPGKTIDVPDEEATQLVDGGYAEYADGSTPAKKPSKAKAKAQAEGGTSKEGDQ